jgi:alpha-galactosidase
MHRTFWLNDPDCLLVRDREIELTRNERELYALAAGALDNMAVSSDRLSLLGPAEKKLLGRSLALRGRTARVSGLLGEYGEEAYLIEGRGDGRRKGDIVLAANLSDEVRTVRGRTIPPRSAVLL